MRYNNRKISMSFISEPGASINDTTELQHVLEFKATEQKILRLQVMQVIMKKYMCIIYKGYARC